MKDHWFQTATGRKFSLTEVSSNVIDIDDIAHSLSKLCRFNGHCRFFYSVAQHSVLMSERVLPEDRLWALLHDASEAYLGDVIAPLKGLLPAYQILEKQVTELICAKFDLPAKMPRAVKEADLRMLATEQRDLMEAPPQEWRTLKNIQPYYKPIQPWIPETARYKFRKAFDNIMRSRR